MNRIHQIINYIFGSTNELSSLEQLAYASGYHNTDNTDNIVYDIRPDEWPDCGPAYRPQLVGTGRSGSAGRAGYGGLGLSGGSFPADLGGRINEHVNDMLDDLPIRKRKFNNENNQSDGKYLYNITKWCFSKKSAEKVRTRVYSLGQDRQRIEQFRIIDDTTGFISMEMVVEIKFTEPSYTKQFESLIKLAGAQIKAV